MNLWKTIAAGAALAGAAFIIPHPVSLVAQETAGTNGEALAIVQAGRAAMGGDALSDLRTLSYDVVGNRYWLGQGPKPEAWAVMPLRGHVRVDYANGRVRQGTSTFQGDEPYFCFDGVMSSDVGFRFECVTGIDFPVPQEALERNLRLTLAGLPRPRGWIDRALGSAETLRYVGERDLEGERYRVVTFEDEQNRSWTAYFEPATNLLARVEGSTTEMLLRSETFSEAFADYRTVGGITIATRYTAVRPRGSTIGSVIRDERQYVNVRVDEPLADSVFARPDGLHPRHPDDSPSIREVAEGVFFLENIRPNYNQLFVEFSDFVLVVDAPYDAQHSARALALIREQIPEKPIRYIVPTHTHYDHMGGLPAYVAEGARVLTTPGNRDFIAEVTRRALSDSRAGAGEPPIDAIGRHFVIDDADQTLELYDIGPNPHADELLILYFPVHRILYVPDVFSADWGRVRPAIPETVAFAAKVEELGLEFEVLLPSHGEQATRVDLESALRAGGAAD